MNGPALERLTDQMARAVESHAISSAVARSIIGQAAFDATGHSTLVHHSTRQRNYDLLVVAMASVRGAAATDEEQKPTKGDA